jgi:hypothetical protein
MIHSPKIPKLTPKEKAQEFLSTKSKGDTIKEVTQLIYFSDDSDLSKTYWTAVLECVNSETFCK